MYLDVCNAASMLWRLEMYGVDIGNRWKDLTEVSLRHVDDHDLVFVSLHYLMALLKGGETAAAARLASQMERYAEAATTQGRVSARSEEHTSELQSLMRISYAVFCLKKKKNNNHQQSTANMKER